MRIIPSEIVDEFSDQIGGRLLEAREQAGLSVEDVQFRTRIPKSVILALEAGDFSVFSSPTYAKSFLSQYSGFLNVEAALWLDALEPASFISGDNVTPLWKTTEPESEKGVSLSANSNGWSATLILFSVTCGLVFAAIKGNEFFEKRFGNEIKATEVKKDDSLPAQKSSVTALSSGGKQEGASSVQKSAEAALPSKVAENPKPVPSVSNEDLVHPAPRAIIVR
jgi:cytoskeletal protein RodZ